MNMELEKFAIEIDTAMDRNDLIALNIAVEKCEEALRRVEGTDRPTLHYFLANAFSAISRLKSDVQTTWAWEQPETINEILNLRLAVSDASFHKLDSVRRCQIRTNLANSLSAIGRPVEAIEQWNIVLSEWPNFAKAAGNYAFGVNAYSRWLYDFSHRSILLDAARVGFRTALSDDAFWDSGDEPATQVLFLERMHEVDKYLRRVGYDTNFDFDAFSLGKTYDEQAYREWCLSERLFLNPLNDVMKSSVAAADVMHLPNHTYKFGEAVRLPMFFNHMKQEFVSARYRFFNATQMEGYHFSDHEVALYDCADAGEFGHHTEELKAAFRTAYSIFDKIGIFLKDYFEVEVSPRDVTFRRIWSAQVKGGEVQVRDVFRDRNNWPLRGLYYLSKDLFESEFIETTEPDARQLATLRNYLEHRYVTLQQYDARVKTDEYRLTITTDEFALKTLRILKLARAALIYLSLAVFSNEEDKASESGEDTITTAFPTIPILRPWGIDQ